MREQSGAPTIVKRRRNPDASLEIASRHSVGTSSGLHPEDRPYQTNEHRRQGPINRQPIYDDAEDDDSLYMTRISTSTRRYAPTTTPPRTVMRVTKHEGPPPPIKRASRLQAPASHVRSSEEPAPLHHRSWSLHPTVYIGVGMLVLLIGWIALSSLAQWWQNEQETLQYGTPRTFQIDANVGHGGMSHFTVENLDGHILIVEIEVSNPAKAYIYVGPVFSGAGADLHPATLSFEDVNGDGYPDMIIAVGAERYILINDHTGFRPPTATDTITGKGV
jgi:hypothetical protein